MRDKHSYYRETGFLRGLHRRGFVNSVHRGEGILTEDALLSSWALRWTWVHVGQSVVYSRPGGRGYH